MKVSFFLAPISYVVSFWGYTFYCSIQSTRWQMHSNREVWQFISPQFCLILKFQIVICMIDSITNTVSNSRILIQDIFEHLSSGIINIYDVAISYYCKKMETYVGVSV